MAQAALSHPDRRMFAAGSLFGAAAAWPAAMGALTYALATPYERALVDTWCGAAPHAANLMLGHCPSCWLGAAMLAGAGLAIFLTDAKLTR